MLYADLVPHEFTHSWNGKYRRPAGLATPNYQEPMVGDLLWVYEGLTEYLGTLLAERSGLWTPEQYREELAYIAAALDHRTGRNWRSLEDTARSVQVLRMIAQPEWLSWRRSLDYYPEGQLLWLDVDTTIRQQTHGKKSLNDFCRSFHGGESGPPKVVPYTFDDVVSGLNAVTPFDWAGFLRARVEAVTAHAPLGGIERGGWKLIYNDQPNLFDKAKEKGKPMKSSDFSYSMGFRADEEGKLDDVIMDSPAYKAGVGPGMKLIAVNGRAFSPEIMRAALKEAHENHRAIEMLIENAQFFQTYSVPYFDGERNPHLERVADQPDILGEILKSLSENRP
jgi:predicted metalloprotease with PDZ domain